eukprot:m.163893 g.163893  ORF g.163893 m.163893 type:complete len:79 (-) comp14392_c0_seq48:1798-2034(-)
MHSLLPTMWQHTTQTNHYCVTAPSQELPVCVIELGTQFLGIVKKLYAMAEVVLSDTLLYTVFVQNNDLRCLHVNFCVL